MKPQHPHAMLPQLTHDERARQTFISSLQAYIGQHLSPGLHQVYEERVKPEFEQQHQRPPQQRHEIRRAMQEESTYQWWSALRRTTQELMWDALLTSADFQLDDLAARYHQVVAAAPAPAMGSLTIPPDFTVPAYQKAVDIHCMPGSYHSEASTDDVTAGALYDRGVYLYTQGRLGTLNDALGQVLIHNYLQPRHPALNPSRILELGCSVGHSLLPYVDTYPAAEIHGIDVAAPMLRYGHARAVALGKPVHFSQQQAEQTTFAEQSFDLIVSHIFLHEIPSFAVHRCFKECYRLLTPGGLMVHLEAPFYQDIDLFRAFLLDWETANNNEPFWSEVRDLDLSAIATTAGFTPESQERTVVSAQIPAQGLPMPQLQGQGMGGRGTWHIFAARK